MNPLPCKGGGDHNNNNNNTMITIHIIYNDNGEHSTMSIDFETERAALAAANEELKWESTVSVEIPEINFFERGDFEP